MLPHNAEMEPTASARADEARFPIMEVSPSGYEPGLRMTAASKPANHLLKLPETDASPAACSLARRNTVGIDADVGSIRRTRQSEIPDRETSRIQQDRTLLPRRDASFIFLCNR